jgi:putative ABC transport system permease protein
MRHPYYWLFLPSIPQNDALAIQRIPHVSAVSAIISSSEEVVYSDQFMQATVEGVGSDYATVQNLQVAQGAWFSAQDAASGATVAVLGKTVAQNLFGASGNPLGQQVRIRDHLYRVVGVLLGQGSNQNNSTYVPLKAAQVRLKNTPFVDQIFVRADTISDVKQVQQAVTSILRQTHHLKGQSANDFTIQTNLQLLQNAGLGNQVLLYLLIGIAAISLTVGGLGIMNIMLVSVTRRTWEIGIRIAIGARRRDIRNQFLIEALLLCLIGGAIGLLLGLLLGWAATLVLQTPFVVTLVTLAVPFVVSAAIAMLFGTYPAVQASRLDPIVALRVDA